MVLGSGRSSRAGFAGFRRAGQIREYLADVAEPAADPGRGQPAGRAGPLAGQADVGGEAAGEMQLGVAGDDDPGPPVGSGRDASARRSRATWIRPVLTASYSAPWPRRHSGSSDSSASMCTRSGRHSAASHASNSTSRRLDKHRYTSPRNAASTPRACSSTDLPWIASCGQAILNATATASTADFPQTGTEGVAVAACCHGDTPGNPDKTSRQRPQRLKQAWILASAVAIRVGPGNRPVVRVHLM